MKPIIVIVLMLASALSGGQPNTNPANAIVSGLAIIVIAVFASAMLFRMIPGMGDDIVAARRDSYDPASKQSGGPGHPTRGDDAAGHQHARRPGRRLPTEPEPAGRLIGQQRHQRPLHTAHTLRRTPPGRPQRYGPQGVTQPDQEEGGLPRPINTPITISASNR
ncbi:hypothetical protein [Streptomyces sp. NPDC001820]|uniref:hypothetical protein n=1 Tax=Streptomyces sp. NPDC001820 TaxID=3364613 RepID=UPI0036A98E51